MIELLFSLLPCFSCMHVPFVKYFRKKCPSDMTFCDDIHVLLHPNQLHQIHVCIAIFTVHIAYLCSNPKGLIHQHFILLTGSQEAFLISINLLLVYNQSTVLINAAIFSLSDILNWFHSLHVVEQNNGIVVSYKKRVKCKICTADMYSKSPRS